jgi:hypothetical protein
MFQAPGRYAGSKGNDLFDASAIVKGGTSNPMYDWKLGDSSDYWTVWKYVTMCHKATQSGVKPPSDLSDDPELLETKKEIESAFEFDQKRNPTDPRKVKPDTWTSNLLSNWIDRPDPSTKKNIHLYSITHFRRYGMGCCFEFMCHWKYKNQTAVTWQKYVDLVKVTTYHNLLKRYGWDIQIESTRNEEQEEGEELSDVDDWVEEDHYAVDKDGVKAMKTKKKFENALARQRRKQRKRKHAPQVDSDDDKESEDDGEDKSMQGIRPRDADSSSSDDSDESGSDDESEDSDPPVAKRRKVPKSTLKGNDKWKKYFTKSSCHPVPSYKVKKMKASERS